MKTKLKDYLPVIIVVGIALALLFSGVRDLTDKDHVKTIRVDMCKSVATVVNTYMLIIPTGNDHYYFGLDAESGEGAYIKASKSWYSKNFDAEGMARDNKGVQVIGLLRRPTNDEVEHELRDRTATLRELGISVNSDYVVCMNYKFGAFCKIALVVLGALIVLSVLLDKGNRIPKKVYNIVYITFFVLFILVLFRYIGY